MQNLSIKDVLRFVGRWWLWLIIGGLALWGMIDSSTNTLPPPSTSANTQQQAEMPDLTPGNSLPTGTVIKRLSGYLQGDGELKISNGTSYDAVAKLIREGTSVFTVYIKAGDEYTIQNISDGTYWLAFAQGTDWNNASLTFNRNMSASSFDDTFPFETTDTQYSTWEVTLNPVAGGTAESSNVDASQFNQY